MKFEIEVYSVSCTQNTDIQNQDHHLTRQMANDSSTSSLRCEHFHCWCIYLLLDSSMNAG